MRQRIWKTFYIQNNTDFLSLKSCLPNFPTNRKAVFTNTGGGGGILETDLSVKDLRSLFRFAQARWVEYVSDSVPSWNNQKEA